jgi:hypothetical protein
MRSNLLGMCSAVAAAGFVSTASAGLVVDSFDIGSLSASGTNLNAASTAVTDTNAAFFPGSSGVRSTWVSGSRGQSGFSAAGNNAMSVMSSGDGSATFSTSVSRPASNGSTKAYSYISYGGAGTNLDLSEYTSFAVAGSGEYYRSSASLTYAFAFLTLTDTANKTSQWKLIFTNSTADSTLAVGDFSFDLAFTTGLPTSPVVQSGFNMSSIQKLTVNFENGLTGQSLSSSWNYTATSFTLVPTPGAIALLGAAGLMGRRRRD